MKPTLLSLLLASALIPLAHADVDVGPIKIYGSFRTAVESVSVKPVNGTTLVDGQDDQRRLTDQSSRLGIKGEIPLNDSLAALFQIESRFYLGNSGDALDGSRIGLGTRNTFVGLKGNGGTVRLGRYDNAYRLFRSAVIPAFDQALVDSADPTGSRQLLLRLGERQGDVVAYESPNLGGLVARASYNFGKTTNATSQKINTPQAALQVGYGVGPVQFGAAWTQADGVYTDLKGSRINYKADASGPQSGESTSAVTLGASLKLDTLTLSALWEQTRSESELAAVKQDQKQTGFGLGAHYTQGDWDVNLLLARVADVKQDGSSANDTGATQLGLSGSYKLHKQVRVLGGITRINNDDKATFAPASGFDVATGSDLTIVSLGLRADF